MNGPSGSYLTATSPEDIIATESAARTLTASSQTVMDNLQRARTEQVNKESAARLAKQKADKAAADAKASQDAAVAALTDSKHKFDDTARADHSPGRRARRGPGQTSSSAQLAVRALVDRNRRRPTARRRATGGIREHRPRPPASGGPPGGTAWDPTLPMVPSANIPGDPVAVINQVLGISATSTQVTAGMGKGFLQQLGILKPDDTGITNATPGGRFRGSTGGRPPNT